VTAYSPLLRNLLIYGFSLPLAIYLGFLLSEPLSYSTIIGIGLVLVVLVVPLLLRWHHTWLIVFWNANLLIPFAPGQLSFRMALVWLSLGLSILQLMLNRRMRFLSAPSVSMPLLFLGAVVLATANLRGGFGLSVLGSSVLGGKRYLLLLTAIAGYFALINRRLHPRRAMLCLSLFLLGTMTEAIGDTLPLLPSALRPIFWLFPASSAAVMEIYGIQEAGSGGEVVHRWAGLAGALGTIAYLMLARYGVQGIIHPRRVGRFLLFLLSFAGGVYGGFRSQLMMVALTFILLFWMEGLYRSRLLPLFVLSFVLAGTLVVGFSNRLPYSMQRSLSFLPLKLNPEVVREAQASTDWRLQIWQRVIPTIPQYLLLGKGLGIDPTELAAANISQSFKMAGVSTGEGSEIAGDYHSGPLSLIIPFGIWGVIGFLWFLWASLRVLYRNYKFGSPEYTIANRFLLAYFVMRVLTYFFVFGSLYSDLITFTGLIGLSISMNGGVARKPVMAVVRRLVLIRPRLRPLTPRPALP
jgi:O-Antigen ligase